MNISLVISQKNTSSSSRKKSGTLCFSKAFFSSKGILKSKTECIWRENNDLAMTTQFTYQALLTIRVRYIYCNTIQFLIKKITHKSLNTINFWIIPELNKITHFVGFTVKCQINSIKPDFDLYFRLKAGIKLN